MQPKIEAKNRRELMGTGGILCNFEHYITLLIILTLNDFYKNSLL
jgi:hypothetical protein